MTLATQGPRPLVSITIPTLNSSRTLGRAIQSIRAQTYTNIEIIIVDGGSTDGTVEIALEQSDKVIHCSKALLAARLEGISQSHGEIIALIDSDQVLSKDCIERAVREIDRFDMICLGEETLHPDRRLAQLIQLSRDLVQSNLRAYLNPWSGLLIPRIFRASLLHQSIKAIPSVSLDFVTDRDHQILFLECYRNSESVGFLQGAIRHDDLLSVIDLIRKAGHWGWGSGLLNGFGLYPELLRARYQVRLPPSSSANPFRTTTRGELQKILGANAIAIVKGIPYEFFFRLGSTYGRCLMRRLKRG